MTTITSKQTKSFKIVLIGQNEIRKHLVFSVYNSDKNNELRKYYQNSHGFWTNNGGFDLNVHVGGGNREFHCNLFDTSN